VYLLFTWQAGKFVADLLASKRMPRFLAMAAIGFVLTRSLVYGFSLDVLLIRDSRYTAEAWMAQNLPKGTTVAVYGSAYSQPRFPKGDVGDHK
jgi:hypothetical protein